LRVLKLRLVVEIAVFAPKGPNKKAQGNALVVTHKSATADLGFGTETVPGPG